MLTNNSNVPYQQVNRNIFLVPLEKIRANRYQVRVAVDMENVQKVATSIEASVMMQVPQGRMYQDETVELIYGHNRFYAHQILAQKDPRYALMEVELVEVSDEEAFRRASIENSDRAGLTVSDQIHSIEIARNEFGYSNKRIGEELLHMGEAAVRSLWRLRKLPKEILDLLDKGEINQQTARRILTACQIADTEKVVSKILGLPERNESSIQSAIIEVLEESGGIRPLPVSDGTTDKMDVRWIPGQFPRREWKDVSSAFPFRELGKDVFNRLVNGEEPEPGNRYQETAQAMLIHMLDPGACAVCPYYVSIYKTAYCAIAACARMKQERFGNQRLAQLSEELGIAIYKKSDGAYRDCEAPFYPVKGEAVQQALQEKSPNLRLYPTEGMTHANFHTNSYWAKLVWVGEKGTYKDLTETEGSETKTEAPEKPEETEELTTKPKFTKAQIDYCTKIVVNYLRNHEAFVTLALALMGTPVLSRTELVLESVASKIVTTLIGQHPVNTVEHLKNFATQLGIMLPDDWDQQMSAVEGNE